MQINSDKVYRNKFEADLRAKVIDFFYSLANGQAITGKRKDGTLMGLAKLRK